MTCTVFGQETERRKGAHKGRPYDDLLFAAVFSELGSNQVVSRALAQSDAIALGSLGLFLST